MVIAVAMDSREGDPLPWIEAAKPTYPTLIDREHRLAELYGIVNVPQAVWIDEAGRIVRPAEPAGAYEGFRKMNRATREMPEDVARLTAQALFRLAQVLIRRGEREEADRWIHEASRLHPDSWCIWRQGAGVNETGLAALPEFWQRVDALGDARYYARVDMPGMP